MIVLPGVLLRLLILSVAVIFRTDPVRSELSDYVTVCSVKDPELNNCLLKTAADFVKILKNGIPELGVPAISPFFVPMAEIDEIKMNLNLSFINMTIYGLDEVNFTRAYAEPENYLMEFEYVVPKQTFSSTYKVDGKILMLPIAGQGQSNISMVDVKVNVKINGEPHMRDGINYMKIINTKLFIEPALITIQLDNLFNGNEMLGNVMNDVLNSNWRDVYESVRPTFEKQYGNSLFKLVQNMFYHTPYDRIFKDMES